MPSGGGPTGGGQLHRPKKKAKPKVQAEAYVRSKPQARKPAPQVKRPTPKGGGSYGQHIPAKPKPKPKVKKAPKRTGGGAGQQHLPPRPAKGGGSYGQHLPARTPLPKYEREKVSKLFEDKPSGVEKALKKISPLQKAVRSVNPVAGVVTGSLIPEFASKQRKKRDKDTKILGFNVEKELEGRGELPKLGRKLGKKITSSGAPGTRSSGVGSAGDKLVREGLDIAANTPASIYLAGSALKEAGEGKPQRAKKLYKDYKKVSAIPPALKGDWGEAYKRAKEYPLSTALELSGGKAVLGRGAGAAARATPGTGKAAKAVRKAGSTKRAPKHLTPKEFEGGPMLPRTYSRDIINKGIQKAGEAATRKVRKRDPDVEYPRPSVLPGRVGAPVRRNLNRRVDTDIYGQESYRRKVRETTATETVKQAPPSTVPAAAKRKLTTRKKNRGVDVTPKQAVANYLIAEGTIRNPKTVRQDLQAHANRLDAVYRRESKNWDRRDQRSAKEEIDDTKALLNDKEFLADPSEAFKGAERYAGSEKPRQERRIELGIGKESDRDAALVPFAVEHMGAKYNPKLKRLEAPGKVYDRPASIKAIERRQRKAKQAKARGGKGIDAERALTRLEETPERSTGGARPDGSQRLSPLKSSEIRAELRKQGVEEPAFISQRNYKPNPFYKPTIRGNMQAPYQSSKHRTGEGQRKGTRTAKPEAMVEQAVDSSGTITAVENFNRLANTYGIRPKTQMWTTRAQALRAGYEMTHTPEGQLKPGHVPLEPVDATPFRAIKEQLEKIERETSGGAVPDQRLQETLSEAIQKAFDPDSDASGQFFLLPADVGKRLRDHHRTPADFEKAFRVVTNQWKNVILTTVAEVGWMTGNVIDLSVRSAAAGVNPIPRLSPQIARADKILEGGRRLEEKGEVPKGETSRFEEQALGGGFFKSSGMGEVHHRQVLGERQVIKQLKGAWKGWYQSIHRAEGWVEKQPMRGTFGKVAKREMKRDLSSVKGFFKLTEKQAEDYARGILTDENKQFEATKQIEQVVGRWGKMSPDARRLMGFAPFVQWLRVGLTWAFITLPAHHPIKTSIAAGLYQMTEEERRKLGLTLTPRKGGKELRGYQQGGLPAGSDEILRFGKFSSFGLAGEFPRNVPEFVFPQARSSLMALDGKAWTGDEMLYPKGHPKAGQSLSKWDATGMAVYLLSEGSVPFLSNARRMREKGGASHPTSTVLKPKVWDTKKQTGYGGAANRIFNPFRPSTAIYESKKGGFGGTAKGGSSSSGSGGWINEGSKPKKKKAAKAGGGWVNE